MKTTQDTNTNEGTAPETTAEPRLTLSVKRVRTHVRGGFGDLALQGPRLPNSSVLLESGSLNTANNPTNSQGSAVSSKLW
ncbi:MAG: hypothetical protein U0270_41125 [Labilithrix sp.]